MKYRNVLLLITSRAVYTQFFFQAKTSQHDWAICNVSATLDTLQHRSISMLPIYLPFTSYIHGSWTVTKQYGLKLRSYWEHLREDNGEHFENLMGIHWEQVNPPLPYPPQTQKKKTKPPPSTCWAFALAAWDFYFLCHHFQPGLISPS